MSSLKLKAAVYTAGHNVPKVLNEFRNRYNTHIRDFKQSISILHKSYKIENIIQKGPLIVKVYTFYFSDTDYLSLIHVKEGNRLFYYSTLWALSDDFETQVIKELKEKGFRSSEILKIGQGDNFQQQEWRA